METFNNLEQQTVALEVTENSKFYLKTAASWSKFLAIMGFIGIGFMVLGAITLIPMSAWQTPYSAYSSLPVSFSALGIVYLVMAIIMFFPTLYLFRFSQQTVNALELNNALELEEGFKNIKRYWKFKGILVIVYLSLCILFIPIMVIVAMSASLY
jgi:hypothetical protein